MNAKMKECLTQHALAHTLTGVGVGIILVNLVPSLNSILIGAVVVVVGIAVDMMRK